MGRTVHQTSLLHTEIGPDSIELLSPTQGQRSQPQSEKTTFNSVFPSFSKSHVVQKYRNSCAEVHGGKGLEPVKLAREPASRRPEPRASLKNAPRTLPVRRFMQALVGEKTDRNMSFPSGNAPGARLLFLANKGLALPWLVNDRAALRPRRIWF